MKLGHPEFQKKYYNMLVINYLKKLTFLNAEVRKINQILPWFCYKIMRNLPWFCYNLIVYLYRSRIEKY